jgi:DNA replication protein
MPLRRPQGIKGPAKMTKFPGFPSGKVHMTPVPAPFFSELMPEIDHLGEMKVTLYAFWFLDRLEAPVRYLTYEDFASETLLVQGLGAGGLSDALERAVQRGTLLRVTTAKENAEAQDILFFLNTPRGRAAVQSIEDGLWRPALQDHPPVSLDVERPNIYRLYEENIGPLTPMIADLLREAEQTYRSDWIEEAIRTAVQNNVRRWKYVEAILRSWQEDGRDGANRRDTEKDRRRYIEGEYADYIEH